eukprot:3316959-Prymnesium_polylepis.2
MQPCIPTSGHERDPHNTRPPADRPSSALPPPIHLIPPEGLHARAVRRHRDRAGGRLTAAPSATAPATPAFCDLRKFAPVQVEVGVVVARDGDLPVLGFVRLVRLRRDPETSASGRTYTHRRRAKAAEPRRREPHNLAAPFARARASAPLRASSCAWRPPSARCWPSSPRPTPPPPGSPRATGWRPRAPPPPSTAPCRSGAPASRRGRPRRRRDRPPAGRRPRRPAAASAPRCT